MGHLVEERQVEFDEIGDLDVEPAVCLGLLGEPSAHGEPDTTGTGTGDDDLKFHRY